MKKNKKTVIAALCMFAAMAAPSLAAEPAQPPSEQAAPIEDADPAPSDSVATRTINPALRAPQANRPAATLSR
jgi:hypothetical protein